MKTNIPKGTYVRRLVIYIAGPMRGLPEFNHQKFEDAENLLTEDGCIVVNPVRIGERFGTAEQINEDPALLEKVQQAEIEELRSCDAILMLSGWERSVGAKRELVEAIKNGLSVYLEQ